MNYITVLPIFFVSGDKPPMLIRDRLVHIIAFAAGLLAWGQMLPAAAQSGAPDRVINVAVAANFTQTLSELAKDFARHGGARVVISSGSTGKLYAQIRAGAPYDIMLSADSATPRLLVAQGMAFADSRFTYARGKLVLWSQSPTLVDKQGAVLGSGDFRHLAIANPKTAPYGAAARATLQHLGLWQSVKARIVEGEDIGQTFQFADSGNAELAFVALAQVQDPYRPTGGSYWIVPSDLYPPIDQQAVLLKRAKDNSAARAFLKYLRSPAAMAVMHHFGYGTD